MAVQQRVDLRILLAFSDDTGSMVGELLLLNSRSLGGRSLGALLGDGLGILISQSDMRSEARKLNQAKGDIRGLRTTGGKE